MSGGPLHLGIDIGTQGVRVVAVTAGGEVVARAAYPLVVPPDGPVQEQEPDGLVGCGGRGRRRPR